MVFGESEPPVSPPDQGRFFSESCERRVIGLLVVFAAVHVFIFSAAFPFFNNVDEQANFDLVIKYSQGHLPRGLEPLSPVSVPFVALYTSFAFVGSPANFPGGQFPPPPWMQSGGAIRGMPATDSPIWKTVMDYETGQPPLYYTLAGMWWHLGQWCGLKGERLLYWLRFLNIFFVGLMVWTGYAAARMIFPERRFLRLGVPALLAFMPQTAFYSINNDVLSPLCFGAAFIFLLKWLRADIPDIRLGLAAGLALAATCLTKMSNLPLVAMAATVVWLKILRLRRAGKLRAARPAVTVLALCAALPIGGWFAWCKYAFGDFTGSEAKAEHFTWTHKPFAEWFNHPIFTPHGLWTFISGLMATFWRGEFEWHHQPLAAPATDAIYITASLLLPAFSLFSLFSHSSNATQPQREALGLGFMSVIASAAFLAFLSIIFDFGYCPYPSHAHPYFTSGRLMLGALIPFMLLFVYGLDFALKKFGDRVKFLILGAMILSMLTSEIIMDRPVFLNEYNWFHL